MVGRARAPRDNRAAFNGKDGRVANPTNPHAAYIIHSASSGTLSTVSFKTMPLMRS